MAKNTPKQIRERREKIRLLLARGYSQYHITDELGITTSIYNRDMKSINEVSEKEFYQLEKSPSKAYSDCISDLDKFMKEGWKVYNDPNTNANDKLHALRTIVELNNNKVAILQELSKYHEHEHDMT